MKGDVAMNEQGQTPEEYRDILKQQLAAMPPYAKAISTAVVMLGQAVTLALNLRDRAVLDEMESVCADIFSQAKAALDGDVYNVQ